MTAEPGPVEETALRADVLNADSDPTFPPHRHVALLNSLGHLLMSTHREIEAEQLFRRAIEIAKNNQVDDRDPAVISCFVNLGCVLVSRGDLIEAERLLSRGLELDRKVFGGAHARVVADLLAMAGLASEKGESDRAIKLLDEAWLAATSAGDLTEQVKVLNRRCMIERVAVGADQAVESARMALLLAMRGHVSKELESHVLVNLAGALKQRGDLAYSQQVYLRALLLREEIFGQESPGFAQVLNALGTLYSEMGKDPEAEGFFRSAIEIRERTLGPDHELVGSSCWNLSTLLIDLDRPTEALEPALRALAIDERLYPTSSRTSFRRQEVARIAELIAGPGMATEQRKQRLLRERCERLVDQGWELFEAGKPVEAELRFEEALAAAEQLDPHGAQMVSVLHELAALFDRREKRDEAASLRARAEIIAANPRARIDGRC